MTFGKAFAAIMLGVVAWGVFHAFGAYFGEHGEQQLRYKLWRAAIVLACVLAYLAFWGAMLAARKRRLAQETHVDET